MRFLRLVRGAVGTAITWGIGWGLVGIPLVLWEFLAHWRGAHLPFNTVFAMVANFGAAGAVSGLVFSVALAVAERRERIETLRWRRVAGWGVLGALLPQLVWLVGTGWGAGPAALAWWMASGLAISSTLGFTFAVGTLAAAKRAISVEEPRLIR
ncbi:MAG TPA: hypothetical protein VMH39_15930 [Gemmatimonadaceae bacterium]|nr:hypothetical protein [Gemmatimonadaceae bacterium]